jgi:hypothetical protein
MSTFVIGATTSTFTAESEGYSERTEPQTGLRVWSFTGLFSAATDYTTLFGLLSWLVTKKAMPGGTGRFADIGGGAGKGTLTLDNVVGSPFTAALTSLNRPSAYPSGQRKAQVVFEEVP